MKTKPYIYVAGPYTKGDSAINTHCQCLIFDRLISDGLVTPYVPLWSHYQHGVKPRPYQDWIRYDIEILEAGRFDAILRCPAEIPELDYYQWDSSGADGEVKWFRDQGLPCFDAQVTVDQGIGTMYDAIERGHVLIEQRNSNRPVHVSLEGK